MAEGIQKFTKLTFIIHFVIALIFTILFFMPNISVPLYGMTVTNEVHAITLTVASAFAGLTVSSLFGIMAKEWKEVKIVVILEVVWLVANFVTSIISFTVFDPAMGALTLVITIILLALFLLTFLQQEDKMKPLLK
ncbi:MAG: hypothetical protein HWN81_12395 [Candidatus Lokiarchaeota archaeon]|nr:hypothetical protein [Candidatus Lokiarchaeota archaeon]